jgi:N-acetylneuraminate synthase/sialic acid synthase
MTVAAFVLGARVIEKHFTLNHAWKGTDHAFSLEPEGMRRVVRDVRRAGIAMGDGVKRIYEKEEPARLKMGKKIVAARDLPEGHVIKPGDISYKSPGDGLPPYRDEELFGARLTRAIGEDESLTFDDVTR